ncbi:TadE family protein [Salinilacustrithrix flava]|uniref:TadE family protein n=1 Tax=Salinilacustrithrix flava TaxID=2957203 RepID=UPI003D7C26CF
MVEFAFVAVLLVMVVFGIITFGLLLSFKQDVTRAAAEGARAGAVAISATTPTLPTDDERYDAALVATEEAVAGFDQECGVDGMSCTITVHDCDNIAASDPSTYWGNPTPDCVTVELNYDYAAFPLILDPPLVSRLLPDTISSRSVARLNQ